MNDTPELQPDAVERLERRKRVSLGVMLVLSGMFGVLDSVYASAPDWEKTSTVVYTFSSVFCLSLWCGYDAPLHGFRLGPALRCAIIFVAIIGFPIYAFKSRGWRGWSLLGLSLLFLVLTIAVYVGAGLLTEVLR